MSNSSPYQNKVNNLVGAMGPTSTATWNNTGSTTGNPWSLSAQPMYYSPVSGKYITSYDSLASQGSASFSYGKAKRKAKRKSRKTKRKSRKTKRKSRKTKRKSRK